MLSEQLTAPSTDSQHAHYPRACSTHYLGSLWVSVCGCCDHPLWHPRNSGSWHDATVELRPAASS